MTSRKWIGTVLITLIVVVVLAAAGCALYRFGYIRGATTYGPGMGFMFHDSQEMPYPGEHMGEGFMFHDSQEMPYPGEHMGTMPHNFQGRFDSPVKGCGFYQAPSGRSYHSSYFGSPFVAVMHVLFLALVIWVLVAMIKRSTGSKSWQLSFTSTTDDEPEAENKPKRGSKGK